MSSTDILQNLEIGGWSAIFLMCAYGIYKLILAKGFASKCGMFQVDLRSAATRQMEINNKQEIDMKKLEIEEMKAKAELLKYQHYSNNGYPRSKAEECITDATDKV